MLEIVNFNSYLLKKNYCFILWKNTGSFNEKGQGTLNGAYSNQHSSNLVTFHRASQVSFSKHSSQFQRVCNYCYLVICLSFAFSFCLVAHSCPLHSIQDTAACEELVLSEPFHNILLALVGRGHATEVINTNLILSSPQHVQVPLNFVPYTLLITANKNYQSHYNGWWESL